MVAYRPARPAGWTAGHLFIRLVWLVVGVIDAIVGLDFVFRLIVARDTGFAHVIMVAGSTLASPFNGIFASVPRFSNLTLQWSDLLVFLLAIAARLGPDRARRAGDAGLARIGPRLRRRGE